VIHALATTGSFEAAFDHITIALENGLTPATERIEWMLRSSELSFRVGDVPNGKIMLDSAIKLMKPLKAPGNRILFHSALQQGRCFLLIGNTEAAREWLGRAELILPTLSMGCPIGRRHLYHQLGMLHQSTRSYPEAIRYYRLAIRSIRGGSVADRHEIILLKARMAEAFRLNQQKDKAEYLVHECLAYLDTLKNPLHPMLLETYLIMHCYHYSFFRYYAITGDFLRHASSILNRYYRPDHYLTGVLYTLKAERECFNSNFENALQYSKHAAHILSQYNFLNPYLQKNYQIQAQCQYWLDQDYEKTIIFCQEAIGRLKATDLSPAYLHYFIGLSYLHLRNYDRALDNLYHVIALAEENALYPDHYDCAIAYQELGEYFIAMKNRVKGRNLLFKASEHARKYQQQGYLLAPILQKIGDTYAWAGETRQALAYYQQSIAAGSVYFSDTSVHANPPPENVFMIHPVAKSLTEKAYLLYVLYESENQPLPLLRSALASQELAVELIEKRMIDIHEDKSGLVIGDLLQRVLNNAVSYAVLLYHKTGQRHYADKAWEYAEKSKMQVLSMNVAKKKRMRQSGLPDSLILQHERIQDEITAIESQLAFETRYADRNQSRHEILARLANLYDRREALTIHLEEHYPAYKRLKYNHTVAGIEQIQEHLEEDQVIVEYQLLRTELITFLISKRDFIIYFKPVEKSFPQRIEKLRQLVTSDPEASDTAFSYGSFVETSYDLFTWLIEPFYDKLRQKRLIVIPHGILTEIPFEILLREKPDHLTCPDYRSLAYLLRELPITYAYTANLLLDRNSGKYGSGIGIFQPDYRAFRELHSRENLLTLEGAVHESRQIKKITHGKWYRNHRADESSFRALAPRFRILHIACHTIIDEKNPERSSLVMTAPADSGSDGYLHAYEIAQMNLHAQLVVLSSCNTGFGLLRRNEGLISLARSFFYAGIRTVLYTLWPVSDQTSAALAGSFYQGIRSKQTPDMALRNAKLNFLDHADPVKTHPFYWSGYVMLGNTDSLCFSGLTAGLILPAVVVIFLIVLLFGKKIIS
jgi:CHAT domain-containing protein